MNSQGTAVVDVARARRGHSTRLRPESRELLSWMVVLMVVVLWTVYLRPIALGGTSAFVGVMGVSMEPLIQSGDLAFVRRESSYEAGDVIAFRPGSVNAPPVVLHRIVGGDGADGFHVQGDNNDRADPWTPRHEDVIGRVRWHVPLGGWLLRGFHALPG